jgi:hypothetical protein
MGPMESFLDSIPQTAAETAEAMEALKVQGIMGAVDALTSLTGGFDNMRDVALAAIKDIIAQLIRMQLLKMAANLFSAGAGGGGLGGLGGASAGLSSSIGYAGLPGFATGGSFTVGGRGGIDKNIMAINGLPIAKVSHGERVNISNDNGRVGGAATTINMSFSGPVSRETMMQAGAKVRMAVASANRKGA